MPSSRERTTSGDGDCFAEDNISYSLIPCELCDHLVLDDCPKHPLEIVENAVPFQRSLAGEPACVALYRSRIDPSKVGAHASARIARNVRFGPLEETAGTISTSCTLDTSRQSSKWMLMIQHSRAEEEQTLVPFYYKGALYFKTCKDVNEGEELVLASEDEEEEEEDELKMEPRSDIRDTTLGSEEPSRDLNVPSQDASHTWRSDELPRQEAQKTEPATVQRSVDMSDVQSTSEHQERVDSKSKRKDYYQKFLHRVMNLRRENGGGHKRKLYKCDVCTRKFFQKLHLKMHSRCHTRVTPKSS